MSERFILDTLKAIGHPNASEITHTFSNAQQPVAKVTAVPGSSTLQVIWLPTQCIEYFYDAESTAAAILDRLGDSASV
ncbi:hypothetical protein [Planococcus lenghuensis]|uniref:Uncharacterized protein n=1 Tax=Planococcus lenghuensis TaxID=2213202 RepID=A0A1Q2L479_9BACL|nr:hypothetical protein [Planococcus lenghuensis]AQQ55265.1 hypothetical protein B0X71_18975 [Planococcus lenghuensis]